MGEKQSIFAKIGKIAEKIEILIASIAFVFMCLFVLTTIVYRYILKQPIQWTEEASRYLMITAIFITMPIAVKYHVHLGVDIFINLLPKSIRIAANLFSDFVTLAAYIATSYACLLFVLKALGQNQTSPGMHIPIVWMYIVIMAGMILATISQISNMLSTYLIKSTINQNTTEIKEESKS